MLRALAGIVRACRALAGVGFVGWALVAGFACCTLGSALCPSIAYAREVRPLTGYLSMPTDQIAVPGTAGSAELTPEGDIYTGWAEYELRFGRRLLPWYQPTRTLPTPALPRFIGTLYDGPVRYTQSVFAVAVGGMPVAYETMRIANRSDRSARGAVQMAIAYTRGSEIESPEGATTQFRFQRPTLGEPLGSYYQPGQAFSSSFGYLLSGRDLDRSGLLLARGPAAQSRPIPTPPLATPSAPHLARLFSVRLRAHSQIGFTWQIPLDPPAAGAAADSTLDTVPLPAAEASLRRAWTQQEAGMMKLSLPERKVSATYEAAIADILDSRLLTPAGWEQTPNRLQYQEFWIRDASIETHALDLAGLHSAAAQNIAFIDAFQQPNGLFISQAGQYDGLGQALWAIAQHALLSDDPAFADEQLPRVTAAVSWLSATSAEDPLGLLPAANPGDDELAYGHITGDDLWAAAGLRAAVVLARLAGRADLATAWQSLDQSFEASLDSAIAVAVAREGHIPPVLDASGGQDWGNYSASYPAEILSPTSPAVASTLAYAKAHTMQGLPTYDDGKSLHDYLGFKLFETKLEAGDVSGALAGLYAELTHTTSTDAGWETIPTPFRRRASTTNLAPHCTFAAEYVALLRNLLIEETADGEVALLAGASPAWLAPGRRITVTSAPTAGGTISFTERSLSGGERLSWHDDFAAATALRWVLPTWARHARLQGGEPIGASIALHGDSGSLELSFAGVRPKQSYARAVSALDAEYRAHGQPAPIVPAMR
jgi:hypothetical protein